MQSSVTASTRALSASRTIVGVDLGGAEPRLILEDGSSLTVTRFLAGFFSKSDQIEFDALAECPAREILVARSTKPRPSYLYLVPLTYVTQPKLDRREEYFLRADIPDGRLNIKQLILPNGAVRDYFYFSNRRRTGCGEQTLYELLGLGAQATMSDLRLAFKVRMLELEANSAAKSEVQVVERAFNLLARPDLRSCYDALLLDPEAPALFPYGGFGSILVGGDLSADRDTFFARRILSFLPEQRERRFRALLRKVEFFDGYATYRDSRRKVEVLLDASSLPLHFDPTWNQWRHLVATKFGVDASFVASGKYEFRAGNWHLRTWETALPSRTKVSLPADVAVVLADAQRRHHRFGQYCDAVQEIRHRVEREPVELAQFARLREEAGLPLDFDIAQVSWKADYDRFYYAQLQRRTRKMFLYGEEFIFELERAMVAEIPQQGHASYVFARPPDLDLWIRRYAKTTREDIRNNRGNVGEELGFIGRVNHGRNPRRWLRELRRHIAEPVDYCLAMEE